VRLAAAELGPVEGSEGASAVSLGSGGCKGSRGRGDGSCWSGDGND